MAECKTRLAMSSWISILVVGVLLVCAEGDVEEPVVTTSTATFRGKRVPVSHPQLPDFQGGVDAYTRIPYAEPPVGDLRFKRPVPKVIEGSFDARRESVACFQAAFPRMDFGMEMSEDCLYLDVFVPATKPSSPAVLVWIHGGGFQGGTGSIPFGLPIPLAALNDVIVVTCNYRVNAFGFLATGDEEIPANLGLLDQRQVLMWVQENIAAFGGDPSRVTIFGESAGGVSVSLHVISPMSAGLFSGAIMQSGAVSQLSFLTMDEMVKGTFTLGAMMNCSETTSAELTACLRTKSPDEIIQPFKANPMMMMQVSPSPVYGDEFLPHDLDTTFAEGEINKVNVMLGCTEDEWSILISPWFAGFDYKGKPVMNRTDFQNTLYAILNSMMSPGAALDPVTLETTMFVYSTSEQLEHPESDHTDAVIDSTSDFVILCPTFSFAEKASSAGNPTYAYLMTHIPSVSMWGEDMEWLGATHGEDIPYVFGTPLMRDADNDDSIIAGRFTDKEVELSLQVMEYWANFAKTGNPNIAAKDGEAETKYSVWPAFSKEFPTLKDISLTLENIPTPPHQKECHFVTNMFPKMIANAGELNRLKALLEEKVSTDSEKSCEDPESCPEE
ncbi:acetylcholinesterase-like [Diadema antillarum]|uniref:acetylcholinesterase-like n=1 Tax=Diadema antillarum TaxID=105358 RepID=UPI003A844A05